MKKFSVDHESVVALTRELVACPSQGGIDDVGAVLTVMRQFLEGKDLNPTELRNDKGDTVGLCAFVGDSNASEVYVLDACLDTANIGDAEAWEVPPFAPEVRNGWLYGRGSADSKVGAAIFAHIVASLVAPPAGKAVAVLFDADEHSGEFGGVRKFVQEVENVKGMFIGYPGNSHIVAGGRGFYRVDVSVFGKAEHSGSNRPNTENAVLKAAHLATALSKVRLPRGRDRGFEVGPKLTVTSVEGGEGFSSVPDKCSVSVDVRLTPSYDADRAATEIREIVTRIDSENPTSRPSVIRDYESWPPYKLTADSKVLLALRAGSKKAFGRDVGTKVGGPSNIGNYLATLGIEATCGFGVTYENLHGTDERIELATVEPVAEAYAHALAILLNK